MNVAGGIRRASFGSNGGNTEEDGRFLAQGQETGGGDVGAIICGLEDTVRSSHRISAVIAVGLGGILPGSFGVHNTAHFSVCQHYWDRETVAYRSGILSREKCARVSISCVS